MSIRILPAPRHGDDTFVSSPGYDRNMWEIYIIHFPTYLLNPTEPHRSSTSPHESECLPRTRHLDSRRVRKRERAWFLTAHGDGVDSRSIISVRAGVGVQRAVGCTYDLMDEFFEREIRRDLNVLSTCRCQWGRKTRESACGGLPWRSVGRWTDSRSPSSLRGRERLVVLERRRCWCGGPRRT